MRGSAATRWLAGHARAWDMRLIILAALIFVSLLLAASAAERVLAPADAASDAARPTGESHSLASAFGNLFSYQTSARNRQNLEAALPPGSQRTQRARPSDEGTRWNYARIFSGASTAVVNVVSQQGFMISGDAIVVVKKKRADTSVTAPPDRGPDVVPQDVVPREEVLVDGAAPPPPAGAAVEPAADNAVGAGSPYQELASVAGPDPLMAYAAIESEQADAGEAPPPPADTGDAPATAAPKGRVYFEIGFKSEADAWTLVASSTDPYALQTFLSYFPNGRFSAQAYRRLAALSEAGLSAPPATNMYAAVPVPSPKGSTIEMIRHPLLEAPAEIAAGEEFEVTVALTEEQLTPEVSVKPGPGTVVTPEGALQFPMPAAYEAWPVDVELLAAGFDTAEGSPLVRRIMLFRTGDSDYARFTLKARVIKEDSKNRRLIARLYHGGRFLGSVSRPIKIYRDGNAMVAEALQARDAPMPLGLLSVPSTAKDVQQLGSVIRLGGEETDEADLEVTINYSNPDELGDGTIYINSRHIGAPIIADFTTPKDMSKWLDSKYAELVDLGLKVRSAVPLGSSGARKPGYQKDFNLAAAKGFGLELYRQYVPDNFKDVYWQLKKQDKLRSIQITSNSALFPWELVVPEADDGTQDGFLGINYRLARWAPRENARQADRPLDRLAFTGLAAVAPAYDGVNELPFQKVEMDALSKLHGFQQVDGDFGSFAKLVETASTGFIHFSGHGEANDPGTGSPVFAIRLLDDVTLDPTTWRALTFAPYDKGNPFYFFNACDTGVSTSFGGFVQGWGPAVLESGASGFIGGMWPLNDRTAAAFSTSFYGEISDQMKSKPVYVAEVLQDVRKKFFETGDPTYLAYTFYGNANLQVMSQ